jgi:hypothetical protein
MTLSQPQRQFVGVATAVDPPTAVDESTAALAAACEHPDANPWAFLFVSQSLLYRGTSNIEESGPHSVAAKWANLPSERVTRADVNEQEITEYEASQLPQLMIMDESESDDTTLSGFIQYSDITKVLYNLGAEPADGQPSGISTVPYGSRVTNRIIDHAT